MIKQELTLAIKKAINSISQDTLTVNEMTPGFVVQWMLKHKILTKNPSKYIYSLVLKELNVLRSI